MRNWMDLNGDGEIDSSEMMFAGEMLCTSREEHEALLEMPETSRMTQRMILRLMQWQQDLMLMN